MLSIIFSTLHRCLEFKIRRINRLSHCPCIIFGTYPTLKIGTFMKPYLEEILVLLSENLFHFDKNQSNNIVSKF